MCGGEDDTEGLDVKKVNMIVRPTKKKKYYKAKAKVQTAHKRNFGVFHLHGYSVLF